MTTMSGTTSEKECQHWPKLVKRMATSSTARDNDWQRIATTDNEWQQMTISGSQSQRVVQLSFQIKQKANLVPKVFYSIFYAVCNLYIFSNTNNL